MQSNVITVRLEVSFVNHLGEKSSEKTLYAVLHPGESVTEEIVKLVALAGHRAAGDLGEALAREEATPT